MKRFFNKTLLGLLVSVLLITLIVRNIDIKQSIEAVKHLNPVYIVIMYAAYYCSFIVRAFRWKTILSGQKVVKYRTLFSSLFRGSLANCVIPARGGELYRAHYFGKKEELSRITVMASIVLERIFDGMILFLILLFLISFLYPSSHLGKVAAAAGIVFVGGFAGLLITAKIYNNDSLKNKLSAYITPLYKYNFFNKVADKLNYFVSSFIEGLDIFHSPLLLSKAFVLTFGIWCFETIANMMLIMAFGHYIGFLGVMFVVSVVAFASLIPAGPAGIGPVQWGYIVALGIFGIAKETAFALSITGTFFMVIFLFLASILTGGINISAEKQN